MSERTTMAVEQPEPCLTVSNEEIATDIKCEGDGCDEKKDNSKPKRSTWCWLLAEDGTPSIATANNNNHQQVLPTPRAATKRQWERIESDLKPAPTESSQSRPRPMVEASDTTTAGEDQTSRDSIPGKSWYWLLAPDGSYATVLPTPRAVKKPKWERIESDSKPAPTESSRSRLRPMVEASDTTTASEDQTSRDSIPGKSWYWLLAPDGSHATVNSTTIPPPPPKRAKRESAVESNSVPDSGKRSLLFRQQQQLGPAMTVDNSIGSGEDENKGMIPGKSWYWLLAPDGSPATVNNTTMASAVPTASTLTTTPKTTVSEKKNRRKTRSNPGQVASDFEDDESAKSNEDENDDDNDCGFSDIKTTNETEDYLSNDTDHQCDKTRKNTDRSISRSSSLHDKKWEEKFQLLVDYQKIHHTTKVGSRNSYLSSWVQRQKNKLQQQAVIEISFATFEFYRIYVEILFYR